MDPLNFTSKLSKQLFQTALLPFLTYVPHSSSESKEPDSHFFHAYNVLQGPSLRRMGRSILSLNIEINLVTAPSLLQSLLLISPHQAHNDETLSVATTSSSAQSNVVLLFVLTV